VQTVAALNQREDAMTLGELKAEIEALLASGVPPETVVDATDHFGCPSGDFYGVELDRECGEPFVSLRGLTVGQDPNDD
jgi:hypothetical protein